MWFDSHCHLDASRFDVDRDAVIQRCVDRGVTRAFVPGLTPAQWPVAAQLRAEGMALCSGVGLHPLFLHELSPAGYQAALGQLDKYYAEVGAVAIGECGLDARPDVVARTSLSEQVEVVREHLRWARSLGAPIVLHVVQAHGQMVEVLEQESFQGPGVLHAYSGSAELVPRYAKHGLSFGFGGGLTRTNARRPKQALAVVPADRLLLETDAPDQAPTGWLAPSPGRNEPAAIPCIAEVVARLRGVSLTQLAQQTTANAQELFGRRT